MNLTCKGCGSRFTIGNTKREQGRQYCGQRCARQGNRKERPTSPYRNTRLPNDHPLMAIRGRQVGAHIAVLWDKIGPGAHPCHYCSTSLSWGAPRYAKDRLETEHLDRDRLNNNPDNLVPSCHLCNMQNRSANVSDTEPWRLHAGGWRIRGNPAVCRYCGKDFVARRDHKGMYCSRGCSNRGRATGLG